MYLLKFAGGLQKKISNEEWGRLDNIWSENPEGKKVVKFKDGTKVLLSTLVEAFPIGDREETAEDKLAKDNTTRIMGYLETSIKKNPSPVKGMWEERIRENFKRINKGLPWLYFDEEDKNLAKNVEEVFQ